MPSPSPGTRGTTVLLVDDDDLLRPILARALSDAGYSVMTAADGAEALALAGIMDGQLGLVVTDIRMPGMDGLELAERVARLRSPPPVLFISGFAEAHALPGPCLSKPFLPSVLIEHVARMVSAPPH